MTDIINMLEEIHEELKKIEKAAWDEFWCGNHENVHLGIALHAIESASRDAARAAGSLEEIKARMEK